MARVRASALVKRETPVSWLQKDGVLIEGVLDLAFNEGDGTIVVDFKTDYELAAGEAHESPYQLVAVPPRTADRSSADSDATSSSLACHTCS